MSTLLPQTEPRRCPWCHQRPDRQQQPPDHMSVSRSALQWSSRRWGQDRRKTRQTLCAQESGRWSVTCRVQHQQHPSMKPLSCSTAKPLPQTCHNNNDSLTANPLQAAPRAACLFFYWPCHLELAPIFCPACANPVEFQSQWKADLFSVQKIWNDDGC